VHTLVVNCCRVLMYLFDYVVCCLLVFFGAWGRGLSALVVTSLICDGLVCCGGFFGCSLFYCVLIVSVLSCCCVCLCFFCWCEVFRFFHFFFIVSVC